MPRRRRQPSFQQLFNEAREQAFSTAAKGMAGVLGVPDDVIDLTPAEEELAWNWTDPNVKVEHLAALEQKVRQALSQDLDDFGAPRWNEEQIKLEIRAQQDRALHPLKYDMIELGRPDEESQRKYAQQAARKFARREEKRSETPQMGYTDLGPAPMGDAAAMPAFAQRALTPPSGPGGEAQSAAPPAPAPQGSSPPTPSY